MMKHIAYILAFSAAVALILVSCEKSESSSTPSLTVPSSSVVVPYEGGTFSVRCKVNNAVDNAYLTASTEEDWISDFDFSVDDTVSFFVAMHYEKVARAGDVDFYYMLDADTLVTKSIHVVQEYNSYYVFEGAYALGKYYGTVNYPNADNAGQYSLYLSDIDIDEYGTNMEGATYYFLDFWTNEGLEGLNYVLLPEGEYSFGAAGENWVVTGDSQYFVVNSEDEYGEYSEQSEFVDGSVTVTRSGDITTIAGTMEDYFGGIHDISYSGPLSFENVGLVSTLEEDEAVGELSDVSCEARYYGDYYQTGTANWVLCMYPEVGTGFIIDVCTDSSHDMDGGVPEGTFSVSSTGGVAGTFLSGVVFNGYLSGTWLLSLDEDGALIPPYAPIIGGTVEISASGDSYTVTIDGSDDRGNKVTGSWTGVPTTSDYRTAVTSLSANRLGILKLR